MEDFFADGAEDAAQRRAFLEGQPPHLRRILVFSGLNAIEPFVTRRPGRTLVVYDAGHQLTEVLAPMWDRTAAFLRALGALA